MIRMFSMNKKGFGLPEVLAFMGLSMFALVVISIYIHKYFGVQNGNNSSHKPTGVEIVPAEDTTKYYQELEVKLQNAAMKYSHDKNENKAITLNMLQKANLIGEIKDPVVENVSCNGYVLYTSEDKNYDPYLSCDGTYTSFGFNTNFIK